LGITGQQDLAEQGFDLCAQAADERGDVGVAGLAVTADGDELHVAQAGLLNGTARYQALVVGQQNDLEHDAGVVGAGANFVVLELGVQGAEVEFVVNQIVQREEGEATGDDLFTSQVLHRNNGPARHSKFPVQ
jgi:hypothetical protein